MEGRILEIEENVRLENRGQENQVKENGDEGAVHRHGI